MAGPPHGKDPAQPPSAGHDPDPAGGYAAALAALWADPADRPQCWAVAAEWPPLADLLDELATTAPAGQARVINDVVATWAAPDARPARPRAVHGVWRELARLLDQLTDAVQAAAEPLTNDAAPTATDLGGQGRP